MEKRDSALKTLSFLDIWTVLHCCFVNAEEMFGEKNIHQPQHLLHSMEIHF